MTSAEVQARNPGWDVCQDSRHQPHASTVNRWGHGDTVSAATPDALHVAIFDREQEWKRCAA